MIPLKLFDLETATQVAPLNLKSILEKNIFIVCRPFEVLELNKIFNFDKSTVTECMNYDENIRFTSYKSYDFISFMYFIFEDSKMAIHEMNVFIGESYLIMVLPNQENAGAEIESYMLDMVVKSQGDENSVVRMYYYLFDKVLQDFSTTLEVIEDEIRRVERNIIHKAVKEHFEEAYSLKEVVYTLKKILRAFLYIGDQFIINENKIIPQDNISYFKNLDVRINKTYDFASSLQEFVNQLMNLYENKISMQTNDIVNKLTVVTVFFGPLTVITGIYGMNFDYMPELKLQYGYHITLLAMALVTAAVYFLLKYKKWL